MGKMTKEDYAFRLCEFFIGRTTFYDKQARMFNCSASVCPYENLREGSCESGGLVSKAQDPDFAEHVLLRIDVDGFNSALLRKGSPAVA